MAQIIQLDDHLSNKIAAGEVVERPASVVKELLENALDAGSTEIDIGITEGGLASISIIDNGSGIRSGEAELAFLRHATSKIARESDLNRIRTLGFRGEALPSIASVAKVTMETAVSGEAGIELRYQGGRLIGKNTTKARQGTRIVVDELFFNTPARLKHMKTVNTELGRVSDVINRAALSRPDVSIRFKHNDKQLLFTNGNGNLQSVIFQVYGKQVAEQMLPVSHESLDYTISGFIGRPELNRASRHYMSTFINGRYIRHFPIVKALESAYHTLLPLHRYPVVLLSITMDPTLVDVNVHPSKWDVRLSKEDELLQEVESTIAAQLKKETFIPTAAPSKRATAPVSVAQELPLSYERAAEPTRKEIGEKREENEPLVVKEEPAPARIERKRELEAEETTSVRSIEDELPKEETEQKERIPVLYPIGQLHGTYILAQNDHGLYMIDQHAAQERIYYEEFHEKLHEKQRDEQELLVPFTMDFTSEEFMQMEQVQDEFAAFGLRMEPFGTNTYRVTAHPVWFPKGHEEETIRELAAQSLQLKKPDTVQIREEAAILMSCKQAIKANRHLRTDEIFHLLERLRSCNQPFTCPHGRNIFVHISTYELEKMFKRVMN
ncbi:DNA mismatch repair endonuclease MutL [Geomicrobium sp. JCM 19039]|uniref:DNA mismatch repair endonuclease MutL n=1 Tax=Geomicrobium sp. JCM 19039 TaxID=1460636 RepID=UPI00045F35D3|nr:DNA mismatch repair endonuclease MutL [Geomicrobium sp. JCM 19039]GAK10998.1 DNA mismatch repair protein MutL [Geomicrobium sp. JCM 19039]